MPKVDAVRRDLLDRFAAFVDVPLLAAAPFLRPPAVTVHYYRYMARNLLGSDPESLRRRFCFFYEAFHKLGIGQPIFSS